MSYSQGTKLQDKISQDIIDCVGKMVYKEGSTGISVRSVLKELNITNRVFYNRFKNIDEVLLIISQKIVKEMRQSILTPYDEKHNYHQYIISIATKVQYLKTVNPDLAVKQVVRFEVGEGIEKRQENFAEEVAKQMG